MRLVPSAPRPPDPASADPATVARGAAAAAVSPSGEPFALAAAAATVDAAALATGPASTALTGSATAGAHEWPTDATLTTHPTTVARAPAAARWECDIAHTSTTVAATVVALAHWRRRLAYSSAPFTTDRRFASPKRRSASSSRTVFCFFKTVPSSRFLRLWLV